MKKKRKRSPTEILEKNEHPFVERGYVTSSETISDGKEMIEIGTTYSPKEVYFDNKKISQLSRKSKRFSTLHNHPRTQEEINDLSAIPSAGDLYNLLMRKNERTMRIAHQDPESGKVYGYFFIKKTKNTPELPDIKKLKIKTWKDRANAIKQYPELGVFLNSINEYEKWTLPRKQKLNYYPKEETVEKYAKRSQERLDKFASQYSLKIRYVPTPGFEYNKGLGFVSKSGNDKSNLERIVVGVFLLIISVFLASIKLTGFVIKNFFDKKMVFSAILFIIGLLILYISIKKKDF